MRKASETQKDLMIDYFERTHGAIEIVSANNTDSEVKRRIWAEVSEILNKVEGGAKKNDLKWSKTWADMKLYTKNRARAAKQGQMSVNARKPSDLDRRVLKVTGHEELLRDWIESIGDVDLDNATIYEKVRIEDSSDHEVVVTEGTDYEYIDDNDIVNDENNEFHDASQYEYVLPCKAEVQSNKRKRVNKIEIPEVIEIHEEEGEEAIQMTEETSKIKRLKQSYEDEQDQPQTDESDHDEIQTDPIVGAINNLANALQSVATALSSFAEVAKSFNKR